MADDERTGTIDLLVGRVGRAHGVRGEVVLDVRSDEPDRRFAVGTTFATARGPLTIRARRWSGPRLLVHFEQASDRTAAERLRGAELRVEVADDETPDDPEEFYDHELIGLRAVDDAGADLGRVADVLHLPAHDVLVVERDGREAMVPFVAQYVPAVDVPGGTLTVTDTSGVLEDLAPTEKPATAEES